MGPVNEFHPGLPRNAQSLTVVGTTSSRNDRNQKTLFSMCTKPKVVSGSQHYCERFDDDFTHKNITDEPDMP